MTSSAPAAVAAMEKSQYDQATKPSRAAVTTSAKKGKKSQGDREKPDFISPEPKNAAERRDWDRMSSRMEGFHSYVSFSFHLFLHGGPCARQIELTRGLVKFRTSFQQSALPTGMIVLERDPDRLLCI